MIINLDLIVRLLIKLENKRNYSFKKLKKKTIHSKGNDPSSYHFVSFNF